MYVLQSITFTQYDENGDEVCDSKGEVIYYTLKDNVSCEWICDPITDEDVQITKTDEDVTKEKAQ